MKKGSFFIGLLFFFTLPIYAQGEPLRVGVDNFYPPFVVRSANNQVFGFDISMMQRICELLDRPCQYYPMPFSKLLSSVENNEVDVAVGAISITPERITHVNFSKPYLESQACFLANKKIDMKSFTLVDLKDERIGVVEGTIFPQVLAGMGVKSSQILFYNRVDNLIDALNNGYINIALMDAPVALYWQQEASGLLSAIGKPFSYGYGIGIAINRNNVTLLQEINSALDKYLHEADFKQDYDKYLSYFYDKEPMT